MGSAFLSDVLTCEGDFLVDINSKINEIVHETSSLKNDIRLIIDDGKINFRPFIKENTQLKSQASDLIKEITQIQQHVNNDIKPELSSCSLELQNLSKSLQEVNLSLCILNQLLEIHSKIKTANNKRENKQFLDCAKLITNVQELIKINVNDLKHLEIFKTLSTESVIAYENLLHQTTELWSKYVRFDVQEKKDMKLITFSVDLNSADEISEIISTLDCLQYTLIEKKFITMFLNSIINEIIMHKLIINVQVNENAILTLEILKNSDKPHYSEVFSNLTAAVQFVKNHLDISVSDGTSFLNKIGTDVGNELANNLIKNCLSHTIPTNSEDLEKYNDVINIIQEFEIKLRECGFFPEKSICLIDYAKNINILFANKFCQSYLEKARLLIKKDLHNITTTEEIIISKIGALPKAHRNILKNKLNIMEEDGFIFPKCQVSQSAEELVGLVNTMIDEILRSQDLCAVRLFYTIRNIFEMYSAIVPLHHKKFLDTLPQQVEEAVSLRTLAAEKLEVQVTSQKNQLAFILQDSGIATLNEEPRLDPNSEKSIRQCIRQLQILQSVWRGVLPLKVYNRAIGYLLDNIIEELVSLILAVEDISSQTATDLAAMFSIIVERTPSLFEEPKEIFKHVKKWQKFNEFIAVLKGSLKDIDDRWSNGMGPLANEFTPEEVKHLIRALFQNSERRSALLYRIK